MTYWKRDIERAIRILEVQSCASYARQVDDFEDVARDLGFDHHCAFLADAAEQEAIERWRFAITDRDITSPLIRDYQAEAAQLLREGWLP